MHKDTYRTHSPPSMHVASISLPMYVCIRTHTEACMHKDTYRGTFEDTVSEGHKYSIRSHIS